MGCESSSAQVVESYFLDTKLRLSRSPITSGEECKQPMVLFGETLTKRLIYEMKLGQEQATLKTISCRVRIPKPKIVQDPLERLYEQSQELFSFSQFGTTSKPPFNRMLVLDVHNHHLFLCGGVDFDHFNVKHESFFYRTVSTPHSISLSINLVERNQRTEKTKNIFDQVASMKTPRYSHTGLIHTYKNSDFIYAIGGYNEDGEPLDSCEVYDINKDKWLEIHPLKMKRANAMCFLHLNKIYVFGGMTNGKVVTDTIETLNCSLFDANGACTAEWQLHTLKMHRGVQNASVFPYANNEIILMGGENEENRYDSILKINLKKLTYDWEANLPQNATSFLTLKIQDKICLLSQAGLHLFNINKGKWEQKKLIFEGKLPRLINFSVTIENPLVPDEPLKNSALSWSPQSCLILGNSAYPTLVEFNYLNSSIQRHQVPMEIQLKPNLTTFKVKNGWFIYQRINTNRGGTWCCYLYNSMTMAVKTVQLPKKRWQFGLACSDSILYLIGGCTGQLKRKDDCYSYNLETNEWKELFNLQVHRLGCQVVYVPKKQILLIYGGTAELMNSIEIYSIQHQSVKLVHIDAPCLPSLKIVASTYINCVKDQVKIVGIGYAPDTNKVYQSFEFCVNLREQLPVDEVIMSSEVMSPQIVSPGADQNFKLEDLSQVNESEIEEKKQVLANETNLIQIKPKESELYLEVEPTQQLYFELNQPSVSEATFTESSQIKQEKLEIKPLEIERESRLKDEEIEQIQLISFEKILEKVSDSQPQKVQMSALIKKDQKSIEQEQVNEEKKSLVQPKGKDELPEKKRKKWAEPEIKEIKLQDLGVKADDHQRIFTAEGVIYILTPQQFYTYRCQDGKLQSRNYTKVDIAGLDLSKIF